MKLFALPDGTVNRLDRAQWITQPFDLAFAVLRGSTAPGSRSIRAVKFRQYQSVAHPVWHPDLVVEATTIDRYEVQWRTPVWKRPQPIHTPGSFIDEANIPADPIPRDFRPWHVEFGLPVRPKFRPYLYQWDALQLEPNQQPEEALLTKFDVPFSLPLFPIAPRYRVHLFQSAAFTHEATQVLEEVWPPSFHPPLSVPVLPRKHPIYYPIGVIQLTESQQPETVFVCAFEAPWSLPVWKRIPIRPDTMKGQIPPEIFPMINAILLGDYHLSGGLMYW